MLSIIMDESISATLSPCVRIVPTMRPTQPATRRHLTKAGYKGSGRLALTVSFRLIDYSRKFDTDIACNHSISGRDFSAAKYREAQSHVDGEPGIVR